MRQTMKEIGALLRETREAKKLKIADIVRKSKGAFSASVISEYERGEKVPPTTEFVELCKLIGVSPQNILTPKREGLLVILIDTTGLSDEEIKLIRNLITGLQEIARHLGEKAKLILLFCVFLSYVEFEFADVVFKIKRFLGSLISNVRAREGRGKRVTILSSLSVPPPSEKIAGGFQQAGGATGRVNFVQSRFALRLITATKSDIANFGGSLFARKIR